MKLYYSKGACSLVVRITLNELQIPCQYESVNLGSKKTETGADFYAINAKGAVPTLELNNGEILTENAVILQYLADEHDGQRLLPACGNFKRYRVLEWTNYITTELHKGYGPLFSPKLSQEVKDEVFIPLLRKKLEYIDSKLANKKFLMGDEFTIADCYLFVMLLWAKRFDLKLDELTNLNRFKTEMLNRPAVQESLQQEGLA